MRRVAVRTYFDVEPDTDILAGHVWKNMIVEPIHAHIARASTKGEECRDECSILYRNIP